MTNNIEDLELIDRVLKGDKGCFDKLYLKYKNYVYRICLGWLFFNQQDTEDACQEIFSDLYFNSLKRFRKEADFSTYLYRISVNYCKNKRRALGRRRKKEAFSIDKPFKIEKEERQIQVPDERPTPREIAMKKEENEILMRAVDSLEEIYRGVFILRATKECSYQEIADILEIDIGTVRSRLNRARTQLKEKLEGTRYYDNL